MRHVSKMHTWFFDKFIKAYNKNDQSNDRRSEHSNRENTDNNQNLEEELKSFVLNIIVITGIKRKI